MNLLHKYLITFVLTVVNSESDLIHSPAAEVFILTASQHLVLCKTPSKYSKCNLNYLRKSLSFWTFFTFQYLILNKQAFPVTLFTLYTQAL